MTQRLERRRLRADEDPKIVEQIQQSNDRIVTRTRIKLQRSNARMLELLAQEIRISARPEIGLNAFSSLRGHS
jgi:hypothetical protein